ncbi:MAG: NAD(P)H-hydrate dehydratase [Lachnospiraceae bacterium]|nr:NAD(P)H-hydrate dehydratase [Lachnospiraceae bacterium]
MITTDIFVQEHLPVIGSAADKFSRGHLLVAAGSYGMAGAAILCIRAAYASGVGYVTAMMPKEIYPIVTAAVPEAVCLPYESENTADFAEKFAQAEEHCNAAVFGPGIGKFRAQAAHVVFEKTRRPLLVDADGLNALSEMDRLQFASTDIVLTPHEGEAGRLLKKDRLWVHENRAEAVRMLSAGFNAAALLKGPKTLVFDARTGNMAENPTGCEALARAGSGDVLSGLIGGLMAQGVKGYDAAVMGAYLHGLAGEYCKETIGVRGTMPGDVIRALAEVFRRLGK